MIYLAYFILFFELLQLLVALANLIFFQRFPKNISKGTELVSVLIPARNEEQNISLLLNDLKNQDYPNLEIIVFNDSSTDSTGEIVEGFAQTDNRIQLISAQGLTAGWLGKNHACFRMAQQANGKYLLFLDADVRLGANAISSSISFLKKHKLSLVSVFPKQLMKTRGEWLTVPIMNYILLSLLPLILVRKSGFASLAAANGQFMLFDAKTYRKYHPHKLLKNSKVEDISIARFLKRKREKIACLVTTGSVECRMYTSYTDAVNGFSKNVISYFGNSFLVASAFWLITSLGFIGIWMGLGIKALLLYFLVILLVKSIVSLISEQNLARNLLYLLPQQLVLGIIIYRAFSNTINKQFEWKERKIT
jgi:glycosyltransferase involved in cell wall biosynthesis